VGRRRVTGRGGNVWREADLILEESEKEETMQERPGDATLMGNALTVVGTPLHVGDLAPSFTLIDFDPSTFAMSPFGLADLGRKTALLNVVVSLDTPVCHKETKRWEDEARALQGVQFLTVSKDLPFAQARWKDAEDVTHRTLSAYQDNQFAIDYGILLKEPSLLQRSVFVIGPDGRLKHVEYVKEQTQEPDYVAALTAAREASAASQA
jgi:thioredoxin-dependent peroxiredoxin